MNPACGRHCPYCRNRRTSRPVQENIALVRNRVQSAQVEQSIERDVLSVARRRAEVMKGKTRLRQQVRRNVPRMLTPSSPGDTDAQSTDDFISCQESPRSRNCPADCGDDNMISETSSPPFHETGIRDNSSPRGLSVFFDSDEDMYAATPVIAGPSMTKRTPPPVRNLTSSAINTNIAILSGEPGSTSTPPERPTAWSQPIVKRRPQEDPSTTQARLSPRGSSFTTGSISPEIENMSVDIPNEILTELKKALPQIRDGSGARSHAFKASGKYYPHDKYKRLKDACKRTIRFIDERMPAECNSGMTGLEESRSAARSRTLSAARTGTFSVVIDGTT